MFKPSAWKYEGNNILRIAQVEIKHKHLLFTYTYILGARRIPICICLCTRFYKFMRKNLRASAFINEFSAILHCHSKRWTKKIKYRFFEMIFWWKKNEFFTYLNACKYANSVLIDTNALERRHLPYHYSDLHTGRIHFFANFFQYNWNCTNICNTTYTE